MKIHWKKPPVPQILRRTGLYAVLLAVIGLSMISAGVWMIFEPAGWMAGGISALLLEHRIDMSLKDADPRRRG